MRLLAINVGLTSTLSIGGQEVRTAYLKKRVGGPVRITSAGPEGNETAVHTDAVYAVSSRHYAHWADRLGNPPEQWPPGYFAENFTFDELDESSLRIGDRLRVGRELELVVAGPRIPCFKLAWRMKQPESFIREFACSGHTGVYFGVAREGSVAAGDEVVLLERTGHSTVAEVAGLVFGSSEVPTHLLRSLLALPCLSRTVALGLRNRLYGILDVQQTRQDRWQGWRRFRIDRIVRETAAVSSFLLAPEDGGPLPRFRAGQFLTVRLPTGASPAPQRTWSLSDFSETPTHYRITIKKEHQGEGSRWMHEQTSPGVVIEARAPAGQFVLDRGGFRPVILVGAGIGITPLLAMAKSHHLRGAEAPSLHVIHCVRNGAQLPFRDELSATGAEITYVFSSPSPTDRPDVDFALAGRLSLTQLAHAMRDAHIIHGGRRVDLPWYDCDLHLCGPESFQRSLLEQMAAEGLDTSRVHTESFCPPAHADPTMATGTLARSSIALQRSARVLKWTANTDGTLLEFLEARGIAVDSGCRLGVCHACRCRLLAGKVHCDVQVAGLPPDTILLCSSRPASESLLLDC